MRRWRLQKLTSMSCAQSCAPVSIAMITDVSSAANRAAWGCCMCLRLLLSSRLRCSEPPEASFAAAVRLTMSEVVEAAAGMQGGGNLSILERLLVAA
jgi:hypothetical protein